MEKKPNIASAYTVPPDEVIERRGGARPNSGRKKSGAVPVSYRLLESTVARIRDGAKERNITMAAYIAEAVEAYSKGAVD